MKLAPILALALMLAGCTAEEPAAPADQGDAAAGDVLGGSISDAMIPLEQIESQAPLEPRQAPSATDVDADQPEITSALGEGAEATAAAPTPSPDGAAAPAE